MSTSIPVETQNQTTVPCVIEANPDVTGTGIRISIYTLSLATGVLTTVMSQITSAKNYAEFSRTLNSAMQLQGLALLCTAIYMTFRQQLTLFHAICVLHLLSLLGFGLVAQKKYESTTLSGVAWRRGVLGAARFLVAGAFVALTAYIWLTAPHFGSQAECNATTVYVVFGVSIRATGDVFRYVILGLMVLMAVGWAISVVVSYLFARCCCGGVRETVKWSAEAEEGLAAVGEMYSRVMFANPAHKRTTLYHQVVAVSIHTGINVYMIVTLEQIVRRNHLSEEESEWTFGQLLALFMLLGVVVEVVNILLPKLDPEERHGIGGDMELAVRINRPYRPNEP
ncbi:hypothetical protein QBC47DRAFT_418992 [Echria macrotheca]|uniref:Uncharacterized protein n=1 Tax=Echria macrotheca TaxID=438768 RepID=A0AAJ0B193_9PEZI|nr:hypothetical protein QBC47DRAFT_418992 [Echria macrotheca]